ncbi:hypothetical protein TRIP_B280008 [uncultured Desulfatiglans sp.]|uniref:Uncharacterized protein n=1 Tax=Uncultured Desulfatiglans sp. TaxID=1748965 RepID=A0A653A665_UNCDX|nr:hypothetical protein TRIP_B280008 [uncultured Desulfatiglans sp.]
MSGAVLHRAPPGLPPLPTLLETLPLNLSGGALTSTHTGQFSAITMGQFSVAISTEAFQIPGEVGRAELRDTALQRPP